MDAQEAIGLFEDLEKHRYEGEAEPLFNVRLDAGFDENLNREFRLRVTTASVKHVSAETWDLVLDVVREVSKESEQGDLETCLTNDWIEILRR
jgi:hypothetical protein